MTRWLKSSTDGPLKPLCVNRNPERCAVVDCAEQALVLADGQRHLHEHAWQRLQAQVAVLQHHRGLPLWNTLDVEREKTR